MKYYSIIVFGGLLYILGGCQTASNKDSKDAEIIPDSTANVSLGRNNSIQYKLIKVAGKKDTISFDLTKPSCVLVNLIVPRDSGNIRINQLVMPNGETDGPFGKSYQDSLLTAGKYQLIIAESLMQENPYTGDYQVKIEIDE